MVAKRGETLAFSILVNNYVNPISEIWAAQDEIGVALAGYDSQCNTAAALKNKPLSHTPRTGATVALP